MLFRELVGDEFAGVVAGGDGDDDVLFAVQHIGHGRAGLAGGHEDGSDFFAGRFVIGAEAGGVAALLVGKRSAFSRDDQCAGGEDAEESATPGARNRDPF